MHRVTHFSTIYSYAERQIKPIMRASNSIFHSRTMSFLKRWLLFSDKQTRPFFVTSFANLSSQTFTLSWHAFHAIMWSLLENIPSPFAVHQTDAKGKLKQQISQFVRKSKQHDFHLTELPAIAGNPATTKIRSAKGVFAGIVFLGVAILIPWFCMDYDDCYLNFPAIWGNAFRPPLSCEFCRGVSEVRRIADVRPEDFEKNFAYNSVPVVVTDATVNWTAMEVGFV